MDSDEVDGFKVPSGKGVYISSLLIVVHVGSKDGWMGFRC